MVCKQLRHMTMKPEIEINVFLKCLTCGTFITSPSFAAISAHFNKCQLRHGSNSLIAASNVNCDDFIDDKTETITFTQPSLMLHRCNFKHSRLNGTKLAEGINNVSTKSVTSILQNLLEEAKNKFHLDAFPTQSGNGKGQNELPKIPHKRNLTSVKIPNKPIVWFNCDGCSARYRTEALLTKHKQYIHISQIGDVFSCPVCLKMVKHRAGITGLIAHLDQHEQAEAQEKKFNLWKRWPTQPTRKDGSVIFSCKHCFMKHRNHPNFLSHMATDHPDKGEHCSFQCPYNCSTQANSIKELIAHFKSDHSEEYFGLEMISDKVMITKEGTRKQKCEKCDKFLEPKHLAVHNEKFHSDESVPAPVEKTTYSCPYPNCVSTCNTVTLLRVHFFNHLEKNPYVCNFGGCDAKASTPSHLMLHMRAKHLPHPICPRCGVTYKSNKKLNKHNCHENISKVESGKFKLVFGSGFWKIKPVKWGLAPYPSIVSTRSDKYDPNDNAKVKRYIASLKRININAIIRSDPVFIEACERDPGFGDLMLGTRFTAKFPLNVKRKSKYKYKCSKCPTVFTAAAVQGYKMHKVHCKGSEGDTCQSLQKKQLRIGCQLCGKSCKNEKFVEKHLSEDHSPDEVHRCDVSGCGRYFRSAHSKRQHFKQCHIDRPYHCEPCRLSFELETSFQQHMEEHRLNPNFVLNKTPPCELCGKVYNCLRSRRVHMKTKHGIILPVTPRQVLSQQKKTTLRDKTDSDLVDFPQISDKVVIQIKTEPELTILPDVPIKTDSDNFQSYDLIGKLETTYR